MRSARAWQGLAAVAGMLILGGVATWWLGSVQLALEQRLSGAPASRHALQAAWAVRLVAVALLLPRVGACTPWRAASLAGLALVAPCWPLCVLAWGGTTESAWPWLARELVLALAAVGLPAVGLACRRLVAEPARADTLAAWLGLGLASAAWVLAMRGSWS